jgi:hypothetical protein
LFAFLGGFLSLPTNLTRFSKATVAVLCLLSSSVAPGFFASSRMAALQC